MDADDRVISRLFEKTSRAENVYESIKSAIISGYWKPGHRINDKELAEKLGVSRVSVREALSKLVENRIIERVQWKGYFVRNFTWQELESIIDVRIVLEELAMRKVMKKFTPRLAKKLDNAIRESEKDLQSGDFKSFMKTDFAFHDIIYQASGNTWVPHIINNSKILIDVLRYMDKAEKYTEEGRISITEHKSILEKMNEGKEEEAVKLLKEQIERHKKRVYSTFIKKKKQKS